MQRIFSVPSGTSSPSANPCVDEGTNPFAGDCYVTTHEIEITGVVVRWASRWYTFPLPREEIHLWFILVASCNGSPFIMTLVNNLPAIVFFFLLAAAMVISSYSIATVAVSS